MHVAVGAEAQAQVESVALAQRTVVGEGEVDGVAAVVAGAGAVVGFQPHGQAATEGDEALGYNVARGEEVVPHTADGQIVSMFIELVLDVEIGEAVEHPRVGAGAVAVAIVCHGRQRVVVVIVHIVVVVVVAREHVPRHEVEFGHAVNLIGDVDDVVSEDACAVVAAVVAAQAGDGVVLVEGVGAAAVAEEVAAAAGQVERELQAVGVAHIAEPRRIVGSRVAAEADDEQLRGAQACRGDDV